MSNVESIKKAVKEIVAEIERNEESRAAINEDIRAAVAAAEKLGISRDALRLAMRYAAFDEKKREGFDVAYQLVREAIGLPIQGDLFTFEPGPEGQD